jgi:hypothetical protein
VTVNRTAAHAGHVVDRLNDRLSAGVALPVVVGAGLCLRVVADVVAGADGSQYEFGVIAQNVAEQRGYSYFGADGSGDVAVYRDGTTPLPSAFMPPAYTLLVAAAHIVTTSAEASTRVVQGANLVLAGIAIYLFARLLRYLFTVQVSILGAAFVAFYPPLVYASTQVSASNAYIPVEIALLLLLAHLTTHAPWARVVTVGLLLGLLTLLRAEAVLLVPLVALWCLRYAVQESRQRAVGVAAVVLATAMVLPVGWLVRSSLALDAPVTSITTTAGYNLWIGNHEGASGSQKVLFVRSEGDLAQADAGRRLRTIAPSASYEVARDDVYLDAALSYVRTHPGETVLRDLKKLGMLLVGDFYDPRTSPLTVAANVVLLAGGLWGLARTRLGGAHLVLLGGHVALGALVATAFFTLERYALPLRLVLAVFCAELLGRLVVHPRPGPSRSRPAGARSPAQHTGGAP